MLTILGLEPGVWKIEAQVWLKYILNMPTY